MSVEDEDYDVKALFNEIWDVEITHKDTPPSKNVIISIQNIIKKARDKIVEYYEKNHTGDLSMINKTEGLFNDIGYITNDVYAIKTNRDLENFFTKMKKFQETAVYDERSLTTGGRRHNHSNHMTMKDIKELCNANQIKLSKVVGDKRVVYKKKELITKLKRKKVI